MKYKMEIHFDVSESGKGDVILKNGTLANFLKSNPDERNFINSFLDGDRRLIELDDSGHVLISDSELAKHFKQLCSDEVALDRPGGEQVIINGGGGGGGRGNQGRIGIGLLIRGYLRSKAGG